MSALEDKLGELTRSDSAFGFNISNKNGEFTITIFLKGKDDWPNFHQVKVGPKPNLHQAVDKAIEVLREHLSDCSLC